MSRSWTVGVLAALALCLPLTWAAPGSRRDDARIRELRERLERAENRGAWDAAAFELLVELDRQGQANSSEAIWLVDHLLEGHPDNPLLLWRRAMARRRKGDARGAVIDLERLVRVAPDSPWAVRALRALPALYLQLGERMKAARADERLLRERLADPVAVLGRLARTYALMGKVRKVRETLARLEALEPGRIARNPDLLWLWADAEDRLASPREAARAMLRFANVYPEDPRRPEALLRAARALEKLGKKKTALALAREVVETADDPAKIAAARLFTAQVLEKERKEEEAWIAYRDVLESATDPLLVAKAIRRLVDIKVEKEGHRAALLMLAGIIESGDRLSRTFARSHFDRLVRLNAKRFEGDDLEAAFVLRLAERLGQVDEITPGIRLAAGRLRERVGAYDKAAAIYRVLENHWYDPVARQAKLGIARCTPDRLPDGIAPDEPGRLAALAREQHWKVIREVLRGARLDGKNAAGKRTLLARAAWAEGDVPAARAALEPLGKVTGEAALLRGDARALAGAWKEACRDFRAAARTLPRKAPGADWAQVRVAACELREGKRKRAEQRLRAILAGDPPEPVRFAVERLLGIPPAKEGEKQAQAGAPAGGGAAS